MVYRAFHSVIYFFCLLFTQKMLRPELLTKHQFSRPRHHQPPKTKTKTETEAPKDMRDINIIESHIKSIIYHE